MNIHVGVGHVGGIESNVSLPDSLNFGDLENGIFINVCPPASRASIRLVSNSSQPNYIWQFLKINSYSTKRSEPGMDVPTAKSLADIYPENALESQTGRWNSLLETFKEKYGQLPEFVSRSPGRVNIIGEVSGCPKY